MTSQLPPFKEVHDPLRLKSLLDDCKAYEKVIKKNPNQSEARISLATTLFQLGLFHGDPDYFKKAAKKFEEAANVIPAEEMTANFYWHWALALLFQGKHTRDSKDFQAALAHFQTARSKGLDDAAFWNDYGNALVDLSCADGQKEMLYDAAQLYQKATDIDKNYFPAWMNRACCYQELYQVSGAKPFFQIADEGFAKAAELSKEDISLWIKWGQLYIYSGRITFDINLLKAGIKKFEEGDQYEKNCAILLENWAEGLITLGSVSEDLDILKKGREKILEALELAPDSANAQYIYGKALSEWGRYFEDGKHYLEAVAVFEKGLERHEEEWRLIYGKALALIQLGTLAEDVNYLKDGIACLEQVAALEEGQPQLYNEWGAALLYLAESTGSHHYLMDALTKFEYAITMQGGDQDLTSIDPVLLFNYSCALDFMGEFTDDPFFHERAIQLFNQLVALDPDFEELRYHFGLAWSHLGELTANKDAFYQAIEQFQRAVTINPEEERAWNDWGLALTHLALLDQEIESEEFLSEAAALFAQSLLLGGLQAAYNLACLYSLTGQTEMSLSFLERAAGQGALPSLEEIEEDEWLNNIRETDRFKQLVKTLRERAEE